MPEESSAHYVRDLRLSTGGMNWFPEKLLEHAPQFTNVWRLSLLGEGYFRGSRLPSLWRLPESVTSLAISGSGVGLAEIWDIMARLPNLDDLSLWGFFPPQDRRASLGIGTVPRGRFRGELEFRVAQCTNVGVMNMLLEVPTGLRFTEVKIHFARECLPSVVRFVEACCKTIVGLSFMVFFFGRSIPSPRVVDSCARDIDV